VTERPGDPAGDGIAVQRLRFLFRLFAGTQCRGRSPVYEALSEGIAADDGLLDLLMATPGEQRRPSLLFAAVNLLLASDPDSELAGYYPVHGGRRPVDGQLMPAFAAFCDAHRDELTRLLRTRSTQTNEIRRCVALRLGLDHVRRRWPGPLALVEAGASAGLNLLLDRYRYRVGDQEAAAAGASPVTITCEVRGRGTVSPRLGPMPEITSRLGIDEYPVNLADPQARAWLEAFTWPEQAGDLAVLRAAVDLAVSADAAPVACGDATTDTAWLIEELPGNEPVVVFSASLLSYLSASGREAFAGQVRQAARHRPVAWIFAEAPGLVAATDPDLARLAAPVATRNAQYLVGASLHAPGERDVASLALADPYLRWIAPARRAADDFQWLPEVTTSRR
jgi:hypothetical protein